jgi:8-amino-7-oxononanoate synthase
VAASETIINYLVNHARSFIFSTALPPAIAFAVPKIISILESEPWRREKLHELSKTLHNKLMACGWKANYYETPIIPLITGDEQRALQLQNRLIEKGFFVPAIRPPSVPSGTSRLRFTLSTAHTNDMINRLVDSLGQPQ